MVRLEFSATLEFFDPNTVAGLNGRRFGYVARFDDSLSAIAPSGYRSVDPSTVQVEVNDLTLGELLMLDSSVRTRFEYQLHSDPNASGVETAFVVIDEYSPASFGWERLEATLFVGATDLSGSRIDWLTGEIIQADASFYSGPDVRPSPPPVPLPGAVFLLLASVPLLGWVGKRHPAT